MILPSDRYLSVARALILVASATEVGCRSTRNPAVVDHPSGAETSSTPVGGDAAAEAGVERVAPDAGQSPTSAVDAAVATAVECPATRPRAGRPCDRAAVPAMCPYETTEQCAGTDFFSCDAARHVWVSERQCAGVGPLPPPDGAAARSGMAFTLTANRTSPSPRGRG